MTLKESFFYKISFCFCFLMGVWLFYFGFLSGADMRETEIKSNYELMEKSIFPLPEKYKNSISSEQGLREVISSSSTGGQATRGDWHNAFDFAVPEKTSVYAIKDGIVIENFPSFYNGTKWQGHRVYGGLIVIKHEDKTYSLYGHLSRTDVNEGDFVKAGEQIGLSGGVRGKRGSGISTGPHLHFAIYPDLAELIL